MRKVYLYDDLNYEYIDVEDFNFKKEEIIDEYENLAFKLDSIEPIDEYGSRFVFRRNKKMPHIESINGLTNKYFILMSQIENYNYIIRRLKKRLALLLGLLVGTGLVGIALVPISIITYDYGLELVVVDGILLMIAIILLFITIRFYRKYGLKKSTIDKRQCDFEQQRQGIFSEIKRLVG